MNGSRLAYIDCYSGASGDMLLGACLDAGLPFDALRDAIGGLGVDRLDLTVERVRRAGIDATKLTVVDRATARAADAGGTGPNPAPHRHLPQILELVDRCSLSPVAKAKATALFRRLAETEAAVHGIPVERVHFHEVGALDSIADIVGTVFAFEWLGLTEIVASPLNTGSGTVRCAHGLMPVPAPATVRLVAGVPVYADGPATELLTPTGALLVTAYAQRYGPLPAMQIDRVGYGAGSRDFPDRANVVRLIMGTPSDLPGPAPSSGPGDANGLAERLVVLECDVDDMNPQLFGILMTRLFAAGARDVFYTAIQMKKGRPGTLVTVLADPQKREALVDLVFRETTTLGVRTHDVVRQALAREIATVTTAYGAVRMKVARREGQVVNAQPEFDDCARLAETAGVPVKEVLAAASYAWLANSGGRSPR